MADILLTTLNARYMHTAFGLRYLFANLGSLQSRAQIEEFTIHQRPGDIAERLLQINPTIISFSVYIWNVEEVSQTVALIKQISPDTLIVLGGPEVSHHPDHPDVVNLADYVIEGAGEISLRKLCEQLLSGRRPSEKIITGEIVALDQLDLPYAYYSDEDIRNRMIYVEASRGCPFKCEFCLSALDKTSKPFELGKFLDEIDKLYQRGARNFKFIDRTFNLKVSTSVAIMEFFLQRMTDDLYLHFEVVPDNLPDKLKDTIKKFPKHSLQFEIGIQTFDPVIQDLISRKQDNKKSCDNLLWLREETEAYIHADLIFGLPGDTLVNFARSFDQLVALKPHEIQLGILKRLRGAPINRHTGIYQLRYNPKAPYNILSTRDIDFYTMQAVNRFARYWDMIGNSGRFKNTLPIILGQSAFNNFFQLSNSIYQREGSTWKISLKRLFVLLHDILTTEIGLTREEVSASLEKDYLSSGEKGNFDSLINQQKKEIKTGIANKRQAKQI
ncbi:MAG: B12-binding domain-containing radical SAM protein [Gammaproteobacteria bacterium]|nr:B12-binding domain-containing radical SAM protein [Gammaproteobacteria bacterium]